MIQDFRWPWKFSRKKGLNIPRGQHPGNSRWYDVARARESRPRGSVVDFCTLRNQFLLLLLQPSRLLSRTESFPRAVFLYSTASFARGCRKTFCRWWNLHRKRIKTVSDSSRLLRLSVLLLSNLNNCWHQTINHTETRKNFFSLRSSLSFWRIFIWEMNKMCSSFYLAISSDKFLKNF